MSDYMIQKACDQIEHGLNDRDSLLKQIDELKEAFDDRVRVIELQLEDKRKLNDEIKELKLELSYMCNTFKRLDPYGIYGAEARVIEKRHNLRQGL
jgi:hypothetical protein